MLSLILFFPPVEESASLMCALCKESFTSPWDLMVIILHLYNPPPVEESASLMCALCKESFTSPWDLMVHAQAAHMVNIYQLANKEVSSD